MIVFDAEMTVSRPVAEVFDFFRRPANLIRISPPELHMQVAEGPELVELGSRLVLQGRRWGISQRVVSVITEFFMNQHFVDEQREGPFRSWKHRHGVEEVDGGTHITDHIEVQPPGGLLGLVVTDSFVRKDLKWLFEYRTQKLRELWG